MLPTNEYVLEIGKFVSDLPGGKTTCSEHYRILGLVAAVAIILSMVLIPSTAQAAGPSGSFITGISIINLTSTDSGASLTFFDQAGAVKTSVDVQSAPPQGLGKKLPGNGAWLLATSSISALGSNFQGSGVVSTEQDAAAAVNTQTSDFISRVATNQGVAQADAGPKLYATQIVNALGGFNSYVSVQNAGDNAADVNQSISMLVALQ